MTLMNAMLGAQKPPPDPRVKMWSRPKDWPIDSKDHLFAARAILQLGRHRFGDAWTDDIPATTWVSELQERLTIYTPSDDLRRGVDALAECCDRYRLTDGADLLAGLARTADMPTQAEWDLAVAHVKAMAKSFWDRLLMFHRLEVELWHACRSGSIASATRAHDGGELLGRQWHFWNMEQGWTRFETCRINPSHEFSRALPPEDGHWIFIERSSFDAYCSGANSRPEQPEPAKHIEEIKRQRSPGRSQVYDWDLIQAEFVRIIHEEGVPEEVATAALARRLMQFSLEATGIEPDEDYMRKKVRKWRSRLALDE